MSKVSLLSSPLLLGFEEMERLIDRVGKNGDGYPPYNIERIAPGRGGSDDAHEVADPLASGSPPCGRSSAPDRASGSARPNEAGPWPARSC